MTRPTGDARRRLELELATARWDVYRLRGELEGLRESLASLRKKTKIERFYQERWTRERIPHVANELSRAEAAAARLADELAQP